MSKKQRVLKGYFLTGLVALLPLWVTFILLRALFYIISSASRPIVSPFLREWAPIEYAPFLFDVICFGGTILLVYLVGMLVSNLLGRELFVTAERLVSRLPIVSDIYTAVRKLTDIFIGQQQSNFKRVVMVEFPRKGLYSVGFLTSDQSGEIQEKTAEHVLNVFIPTTPNPTTGFLVMVPKEDVTALDMSVDDAVRLIISGGIVTPKPSAAPRTEALR